MTSVAVLFTSGLSLLYPFRIRKADCNQCCRQKDELSNEYSFRYYCSVSY